MNNATMQQIPPAKKAAPGNLKGAELEENIENKLVMTKGPMKEVMLIKEDNVPCISPCSFKGTCLLIIDCKAGVANPPRQYGTRKKYIIQPLVAKEKRKSPAVEKIIPIRIDFLSPNDLLVYLISPPCTSETNTPTAPSEYPISSVFH